jgi:hypothetical protein
VTGKQTSNGGFDERLLAELKAVVAERAVAAARVEAEDHAAVGPAWRRLGPRFALGSGIAVAAVATALLISAGGDSASKAFAVVPQPGGGVTIKIYSLEDASGLEKALTEAGVSSQVTWLPAGKVCREPHYKRSIVHLPGGGSFSGMQMGGPGGPTIAVGSTRRYRESLGKHRRGELLDDELANLNLDPAAFRPDQSVVISGTPTPYNGDPEGGSIASLGVAEGPVEPCEPVPALPSGSGGPVGLLPGGGPAYVPHGDKSLSHAAIATDLRRTAAIAGDADSRFGAPPGPGDLLYTKTLEVHLEAWDPDGPPSGSKTEPRYFTDRQLGSPSAMPAFVSTLKQVWTAADGTTRKRETLEGANFLSTADQRRWETAGSPPPWAFDPTAHHVRQDASGRALKNYASMAFRGRHEFAYLARVSELPTEPEALRLKVENRPRSRSALAPSPASSERGGATVERLLEILSEPLAGPQLRAAAFGALAELPGIGFQRGVVDAAGRRGDAIAWVRERGFGRRWIFDPRTSKILAQAELIFGPPSSTKDGVPPDTVFRETAYLQASLVSSTHEGLK